MAFGSGLDFCVIARLLIRGIMDICKNVRHRLIQNAGLVRAGDDNLIGPATGCEGAGEGDAGGVGDAEVETSSDLELSV